MKHWGAGYKTDTDTGLCLKTKDGSDRILYVSRRGDKIQFLEGCDQYYYENYTKEEALELVEELKQWIEAQNV